jgi:hypothetical protein
MEQVTQEMIEELAANMQLLAVDHRQRAADYRQKGRKKEVPEAKINRAFDEFIEVLREGSKSGAPQPLSFCVQAMTGMLSLYCLSSCGLRKY